MNNFTYLSKDELKKNLTTYQDELNDIDNLPFYYFIMITKELKKQQLLLLIKEIKMEIIYREDDEKREKYKHFRENDPLKYGKRKHK